MRLLSIRKRNPLEGTSRYWQALETEHEAQRREAAERHHRFLDQYRRESSAFSQGKTFETVQPEEDFAVAISFAGPQRTMARELADLITDAGYEVAFDELLAADLWGSDLASRLDAIFGQRARHCVVFVSRSYAERVWPRHEFRSAVARNISQQDLGYILPIRVDDIDLPGLQPTIGYLSLKNNTIPQIASILIEKLGGPLPEQMRDRVISEPLLPIRVPAARASLEHEFRELVRELSRWLFLDTPGAGTLTVFLDMPHEYANSTESARIVLGPAQQEALEGWKASVEDLGAKVIRFREHLDSGDSLSGSELREQNVLMHSALHELRTLLA